MGKIGTKKAKVWGYGYRKAGSNDDFGIDYGRASKKDCVASCEHIVLSLIKRKLIVE